MLKIEHCFQEPNWCPVVIEQFHSDACMQVEGGDEDNMPMTRRVQRDIWLHQHPRNCSHESVRFLLTDWVSSRRFGLGAQLVHAGGLLSIAMRDNRVLVLEKLDRANHGGCQGYYLLIPLASDSRYQLQVYELITGTC